MRFPRLALGLLASVVFLACDGGFDPGFVADEPQPVTEAKESAATAAPKCTEGATAAPITMLASAPLGISEAHLGRPVDASFESFAGEAGATLFPKGTVRKQGLHRMEHGVVAMESKRTTDANIGISAKSWGLGADTGKGSASRFASYRASQLVEAREIDDTTEVRTPPPGAVWYIARIYYGRSYELVFHGTHSTFHAGVKARLFFAKGGVKTFAEQNGLSIFAQGRGLEPVNGQAIFAQGEEEISKAYQQSGDPVPIMVEYRSIPRTCVPDDEAVEWVEPYRARVTFDAIDVYRHCMDTWSLEAKCSVNDRPVVLEQPTIWKDRTGVSSQCMRGEPGPQGNPDYCPYQLYFGANIELVEGDRVRCGVTGTIGTGAGAKAIVPSEFSEIVTKSGTQAKTTFGDGDANVEYRVHYKVTPGG